MSEYRIERDSMGEVRVPADALYGAQTQRAVENFPVSGVRFGRPFIRALGLIKGASAGVNHDLGLLDADIAGAVQQAAAEVAEGRWDAQFPIDIYQTGSGTSTNMNANEVIAARAGQILGRKVHPNDHVNMGQSSNDVIPSAIYVAAYLTATEQLIPALRHLHQTLERRAAEFDDVVKTGRTHLMDATPVRLSQEIGGWAAQVEQSIERIESNLPRIGELALGGTAVGTGINAHEAFAGRVATRLARETGGLMKIADDLRWMNSGPIAGLGEIALPSLQPGSSIMPGKVNPVIAEAVMMVCAQVMGNDVTIGIAGSRGNFQLNVMLPVLAHNLLESLTLLANVSRLLTDRAVAGFTVNRERVTGLVDKNPILVTALNARIGYDLGAKIAKTAYAEGRSVREVARELTDLTEEELDRYLDPRPMTEGGITGAGGGAGG
jgi:fumarate hydratase, class II